MHEEQLAHSYCVAEADPPNVSGSGNYIITLLDQNDETAAALYFLDSGDYSSNPSVGGYDWIQRDQIEWYVSESQKLSSINNDSPLPALAFFHIPLPEYQEVWNNQTCLGHCFDGVSARL